MEEPRRLRRDAPATGRVGTAFSWDKAKKWEDYSESNENDNGLSPYPVIEMPT